MHVVKTSNSNTEVKLTITAAGPDLAVFKNVILKKLSNQVKMPGFREGTAPISLVEKNVDQNQLQTEFLDLALTELYAKAAQNEGVRPVTRPDVQIKKFVPFSELEFEVTTNIIGQIKLPNYKTITSEKPAVSVVAKDVDDVVKSLQVRMAERNDVDRAAKSGDQVLIDFAGFDDKDQPVSGADGQDYPLLLGSNSFIPGFEDNLIDLKTGQEKTFTLTFPKDYGVSALANKKVTFKVTIKKVQEMIEPKVDDDFAAKCGPFKTIGELKDDIKKQLTHEREHEATKTYQNDLVKKIVDKSSVALPDALIDQQVTYNIDEVRRNLAYRGQTYEEYLELEQKTEEEYKKEVIRPQADQQLKTSIVLAEIAEKENISVTPEELEVRLQLLKGQYASDPQMQAELEKPENRQDIASRMQTEKVLNFLTNQGTIKNTF